MRKIQVLEQFGYKDVWTYMDGLGFQDLKSKKKGLRNITISKEDADELEEIFRKKYKDKNYKLTVAVRMIVKLFLLMEVKRGTRSYFI